MNASPSVTDTIMNMVSQSIQVITKPSVATFEQYENKGNLRDAIIYVGIFAVITGLFGLGRGAGGFLGGVIATLLGFLAFTYLIYYVGKSQGGTGTFDQVAYTFSLFWAPMAVIFGIIAFLLIITLIGIFLLPLLGIAAIVVNIYFAYLAVQSSMNLKESGKIWITLIAAGVGAFLVNVIVSAIFR